MNTQKIDELVNHVADNISKYDSYIHVELINFNKNSRIIIDELLQSLDNMIKDGTLTDNEVAYYVDDYLNSLYDTQSEEIYYIIENVLYEYCDKYKWFKYIT